MVFKLAHPGEACGCHHRHTSGVFIRSSTTNTMGPGLDGAGAGEREKLRPPPGWVSPRDPPRTIWDRFPPSPELQGQEVAQAALPRCGTGWVCSHSPSRAVPAPRTLGHPWDTCGTPVGHPWDTRGVLSAPCPSLGAGTPTPHAANPAKPPWAHREPSSLPPQEEKEDPQSPPTLFPTAHPLPPRYLLCPFPFLP